MKDIIKLLAETTAEQLAELGIKVKRYEDRVLLDYDQINSPKTHPLVMQCRGVILTPDFKQIICRPFDRFFNLGEAPETQAHLDMTKAVAYDKVDGSLIKIYFYNGKWEIATRGTCFAESNVNGFDMTFRDLVLKALACDEQSFQDKASIELNKDITYLFEVTSFENRVVTTYTGYLLHYLGARFTKTGKYVEQAASATRLGAVMPKQYGFVTKEEAIQSANALSGLKEGFVVWQDGKPVAKVKSDAYVAVHHIRGEGLSPKRIAQLVLTGEQDEYLTYFAEDRQHFEPYIKAHADILLALHTAYEAHKHIQDQKEFAIAIKDLAFKPVLFEARKNGKPVLQCWLDAREGFKVDLLVSCATK